MNDVCFFGEMNPNIHSGFLQLHDGDVSSPVVKVIKMFYSCLTRGIKAGPGSALRRFGARPETVYE